MFGIGRFRKQRALIQSVAALLLTQKLFIANFSLCTEAGDFNERAVGYIYGFSDCAAQIAGIGFDDLQWSEFIAAIYEALGPGAGRKLASFVSAEMRRNSVLMEGVLSGAKDYRGWVETQGKATPMGLFRIFQSRSES